MPTKGDYVEKALDSTETNETNLGTITISAKGRRIIGVYGIAIIETATADEGTAAVFRLASEDVDISPCKFPAQVIYGPAGTLADSGHTFTPKIIPVDIPVGGKARIVCYMKLTKAQTGSCRGLVGVIYE